MTPMRKRRLTMVGLLVAGVAVATGFALKSFNQNIMFFYSPLEVKNGKAPLNKAIRIGGMVVEGTVNRPGKDLEVKFDLSDTKETVTISYTGILPDLFREGQGIIASGRLNDKGVFIADEVLAKHDENYMPPEVAAAMEKAKAAKLKGDS